MRGQTPLPRNRRKKDTKRETAPGQLPVRASVPTHFPSTRATLAWRANVERGAARLYGIH